MAAKPEGAIIRLQEKAGRFQDLLLPVPGEWPGWRPVLVNVVSTLLTPDTVNCFALRLRKLTPETQPVWGTLTATEMLCHIRCLVEISLEQRCEPDVPMRFTRTRLFKWVVINLPWPKGKINAPAFLLPEPTADIIVEQDNLVRELVRFAEAAALNPYRKTRSPILGPITLRDWSKLHAKHLEHHLGQFGV